MGQIAATGTLFRDDFNAPLDSGTWSFPTGNPSFLGNTQIRASLPVAEGGNAVMQLDTFNPTGNPSAPTYFGTAAFTQQSFGFALNNSPGGIAFETRARLDALDPNGNPVSSSGLIAGVFPFVALTATNTHDEIDFEWIPKRSADPADPNLIQTNAYQNDPYDNGIYQTEPIPNGGVLTDFHVYRIEWMPGQVRWLVDGSVIRTETTKVPTNDMQLWMNIWAGQQSWDTSDYANLPPVGDASQNQTRQFLVDYVSVESLSAQLGGAAADRLLGSAAADHLRGAGGRDQITADAGEDSLYGGGGADLLSGEAGDDRLSGGNGADTLLGGAGTDRLVGGGGADVFRIDSASDSAAGRGDVIVDFDRAEGDRIDLSRIDTDPAAAGTQGFSFIGGVAFGGSPGAPGPAQLRLDLRGGSVLVEGDVDGDGIADIEIRVRDVAALVREDFIL